MPKRFGIALAALLALAGGAAAQNPLSEKLSEQRIGDIEPGTYSAGEDIHFAIDPYGDKYLLRFAGDTEIFVLYTDHASLGARELKYDSGETALMVSGFGSVTLYTDSNPSGLPAQRDGDSFPPTITAISLPDMQEAAQDEAEHLAYVRRINLAFDADWGSLAGDPNLRALAFDAMQNAARGLERFAAWPNGRSALNEKVATVKLVQSGKPTIALNGKTLAVTFTPSRGYAGRASSRAIARALGKLFSISDASGD
jgi:hypothetical protein